MWGPVNDTQITAAPYFLCTATGSLNCTRICADNLMSHGVSIFLGGNALLSVSLNSPPNHIHSETDHVFSRFKIWTEEIGETPPRLSAERSDFTPPQQKRRDGMGKPPHKVKLPFSKLWSEWGALKTQIVAATQYLSDLMVPLRKWAFKNDPKMNYLTKARNFIWLQKSPYRHLNTDEFYNEKVN